MPPQSRGSDTQSSIASPTRSGFQSRSTPNLPTLRSLAAASSRNHAAPADSVASSEDLTSPSEPTSIDDYEPPRTASSQSAASSEHDGSEEEDQDRPIALPTRPMYSHHFSRSHTYLGPSTFAPPFYNRPPTPLPPSPSLTSLLRPTFSSSHNSRPTTPDPSSDEGLSQARTGTGSQTPNSAAVSTLTSSFKQAKPVPRASPKVPTYEYYGFTLYLTSSLAFVVYLLWSFLPSPFLHSLGIYYYPNRWWALAIPAWTVMFIIYIYVALAAYNTGHLTLPLEDVECLVDEAANIAVVDSSGQIIRDKTSVWRNPSPGGSLGRQSGRGKRGGHGRQSSLSKVHQLHQEVDWRTLWREGTDAVMDIPVGGVCEILYGGPQSHT